MSDYEDRSEPVTIRDVLAERETERALLCNIDNEEIWIPLSQIKPESEVQEEGDSGTLVIPLWLAEREGLT